MTTDKEATPQPSMLSVKSKTISVKYENFEVVVGVADADMGMYRTLLIEQAQSEEALNIAADLKSLAIRLNHVVLFPSMVAAVVEQRGFSEWPISYQQYRKFPEQFLIEWEQAVFSLNGHWQPKLPEEPAKVQKKATKSTLK
jgi:hypothetical protein